MGDYNVDDALGYLNIDKGTALKKVGRLLNSGSLTNDLLTAQAILRTFQAPIELNSALNFQFGTISIGTLQPKTIPDSYDVTIGAYTCLQVGSAFLEFVGQLWGVDGDQALAILAGPGVYDPVPGWSTQEVLKSIQVFFAGVTIGLVGLATGGTGVPFTAVLFSGLIGLSASFYAIYDQHKDGLISDEDYRQQLLILGVMGAVDLAGLKLSTVARGRFLLALQARPQLLLALDELTVLSLDTIVGESGNFDGTVETLTDALVDSGVAPGQAQGMAQEIIDQLVLSASEYKIPLPSGASTHPVPANTQGSGPLALPIEVVNGLEVGPERIGLTGTGEYSNDQILNVLRDYPDFDAWWTQRAHEFGYQNSAELDIAIANSDNGVHDIIGKDLPVPAHYYDLIWLRQLYLHQ